MAGNALLYGIVGFIAGVVLGGTVRELAQQHLGFDIPSLYASSYQAAGFDDPNYTTRTALVGAVSEKDYDSNLETHINHIPIG